MHLVQIDLSTSENQSKAKGEFSNEFIELIDLT
jgi:hypothetical protein